MNTPYRVIGSGQMWTVEGPRGEAGGTCYLNKADAQEEANALNYAYASGYKAGREEG